MKKIMKICFVSLLAMLVLTACSKRPGQISVETQSYNEKGGKLEQSGWEKAGTADAVPGEVIYTNGQITATVGNVSGDTVQVKFSGQVVHKEENRQGDVFNVGKNRTYTFIAGGGTQGLQIKLRYN